MDQAARAERDQLRLRLAPAGQRGRPLARAIVRIRLLAAGDGAAIDDAGDDRRQLAGGGRQHGVVDQRQPLGELPLTDQRAALQIAGKGDQIPIAEALADLRGAGGGVVRGAAIALRHLALRRRQQQVPLLGAVAAVLFNQALGARQPAAGASGLAQREQPADHPQRDARRGHGFAGVQVQLVKALQQAKEFRVAPGQPRRPGQKLQVSGLQRRRLIGGGQRRVGVIPGPPRVGRPPTRQRATRIGVDVAGGLRLHRRPVYQ